MGFITKHGSFGREHLYRKSINCRKSDGVIVALKLWKHGGAKGFGYSVNKINNNRKG